MDFSLNIKQELKLFLTQDMKISLNVLEMSNYDLEKFLIKQKEKNPLIEIDFSNKKTIKSKDNSQDTSSPMDYVYKEESLIDYLEEQIGYLKISKGMRFLCIFIINNLDKRGYLPLQKKEIKNLTKYSMKEIDDGLNIIKNLEPIGIGSENLEECLIYQLHKKDIFDTKLEYLIKHFLKEIANNNFKIIVEKLEITEKQIMDYLKIIRTLNPIPSRGYYMGDNINYIAPEAKISKVDGEYKVIMLDENIPKVKIKSEESQKENKCFMSSAQNLIKFLKKRQETLENILNVVLEKQYDYFSKEEERLKTFTLKEVSERLEMHESTISRAIKNKYILTDRGMQRIKDMFVLNEKKEIVLEIIETLILNEDRKKPYTDQQMSDYIAEYERLKIARRTVAKYREELGIQATSKRKIKL